MILTTVVLCPICLIPFDSHLSFRQTGILVDEHVKAKHPEALSDVAAEGDLANRLYREKGLSDNDKLEFADPDRLRRNL